jgi:hypothetical protein
MHQWEKLILQYCDITSLLLLYKEKAVEGIMQDGCTETRRLSMKMETILHHCACLSAFQSMLNVIMQREMSKSITLKGVMS